MGSLNIQIMRSDHPGKSDAEAAKAFAQKNGYIAIVRYKNSRSASDFTDIGMCKMEDEIQGYMTSTHCHGAQIIFDGRSTGTDDPQVPQDTPESLYNRGVSLFVAGMFEDAAQHFMHCFQNGRYQFQAAYARALCQEKLGQNIVFPEGWQLSNRELPGAIYVASNLTCYLVAEGHRAALTKEGSDGGQSEVTAAILGNTYRIDVTASWGSFSSYPWRILPNGDFLKILDRHANQNPTRGDRYVIDLIRRTSSLPMTALPAHGLPRTIGSQQLAKTEQKPEELTFAEKIKQLKSELREDARVDASREAATKHPKAAEWGERVVGVIAVIVVIAICLGAIGFLVWWIQWLSK